MAIRVHLAALLLLATVPLSAQTTSAPAQTLPGHGWGVDHVGVGARDLAQAQHDYEQLGFKVGNGGHFPGDVSNSIVSFQKNSHLELLSVSESTPIKKGMASMIADFLKKHDSAMFLGIEVSSAKATADYLKARKFDATGPDPGSYLKEGETTLLPPMWYSVAPNDEPAAGKRESSCPFSSSNTFPPNGEKSVGPRGRWIIPTQLWAFTRCGLPRMTRRHSYARFAMLALNLVKPARRSFSVPTDPK
jgi:catechol 2,3-dioxygenase-like lactoylglutathione lyase family enzyme